MKVYFIGAGPGDPELITVKGARLLRQSAVILYAGSLVPEALLSAADAAAKIINTAELHLDEIIEHIVDANEKGLDVARLHSGDPAIYGAIGEQIRRLQALGIPYEIIPGVSAMSASAAYLGKELTLSGVSQTIIITRCAGKTPMPERESIEELAKHRATLAIHLSVNRIHKLVKELIPYYGSQCPVAVCYRTSWPDQSKVTGTLENIVAKVREQGFTRTALILVGEVIEPSQFDDSYLYDQNQAHIYRPKVRSVFKK